MASFGEELKRERELRDISLKEISEATKISIRFLEALEQNNFEVLPGGVFNRGFIRAYARFIGVDSEEMVNAYLHEVAVRESRQSSQGKGPQRVAAPGGASAEASPSSSPGSRPSSRPASRPVPILSSRAGIPPETGFSARSGQQQAGDGRTSIALWVLVAVAVLVGVGVIAMSFVDTKPVDASAEGHAQALRARLNKRADGAPDLAGAGEIAPQAAPPQSADSNAQAPQTGEPQGGVPAENLPGGGGLPASPDGQPATTGPVVTEHQLRVRALEATRVIIECGGKVVLDQELWPGQSRSMACSEPVMLSAANGGGLEYTLDGSAAELLGGVGEQVEGRTLAPLAAPPSGPQHVRDPNARE